jgi:hypothetical protein
VQAADRVICLTLEDARLRAVYDHAQRLNKPVSVRTANEERLYHQRTPDPDMLLAIRIQENRTRGY